MNDLRDAPDDATAAPDPVIAELRRSNAALARFASVVSHDLQEPLRTIGGCLASLQKNYHGHLDASAEECLTFAVQGAARMRALVSGLLAYSIVGTGAANVQRIDCKAVFNAALDNLRESIRESSAVVTHDELPEIDADSLQIGQVFQNLIGNAIKYRHKGQPPKVHVGARRKNGAWLFSVRDNGIGIAAENRQRIFEPFQRLNRRDDFEGSGLGLAFCKKIVENHGGRLWMTPANPGSCFSFTVPVVKLSA